MNHKSDNCSPHPANSAGVWTVSFVNPQRRPAPAPLSVRIAVISTMLLGMAWSCAALDSTDLLFDLTFQNGVSAEFARGSAAPLQLPENLPARLVPGLFGPGYAFRGQGSDLDFATGAQGGPRACDEMYGPRANFFGDAGTVAFWVKPLTNTHNMASAFFRYQGPGGYMQIARNQYTHHQYSYGLKNGYVYDGGFLQNPWLFFALTWREGEARAYFNGHPMSVSTDTGVMRPTVDKFEVACAGMTWLDFQTKTFADDAVLGGLQIFRRPLSDEEVRSLFERGQVTTRQQVGNIPDGLITKPERAYAATVLAAPVLPAPITVDGALTEWPVVPAQGGFIERRLGVLDNDDAHVSAACDATNLYLGFRCQVDEKLRNDPTHIWYPTGEFKAGMQGRDSDVHADDYLEFVIKSKDGHEYRIAVNAGGAVLDSRDGDKSWNTTGRIVSRSNFEDWTAELAIPLAELGLAVGDTVGFNVIRSWKLFKSAQNTLCATGQGAPSLGQLTLGGDAAAVTSLGRPWTGALEIRGLINGAAGTYTVNVEGQGYNQQFAATQTVAVATVPAAFAITHKLEKPGDVGLVVRVKNPAGKKILVRSLPFVYVAASTVELANYPGWGRLEVNITSLDTNGLQAVVALEQDAKALLTRTVPAFTNPAAQVMFATTGLATGAYQVVTRLMKGEVNVFENRQPYVKQPRPEWYHGNAGVIATPPGPWTPVKARWSKVTLLDKEVVFQKTLFPAQITANGEKLFAGPVRIRVQRGGQETVLSTGAFKFTRTTPRQVEWTSTTRAGDLAVMVTGRIEFDGFTWMDLTLAGGQVDHLQVEIPLRREAVTLKTHGAPLLTNGVIDAGTSAGYWFGSEQAGLSYWWEDTRGWELNNESVRVIATNSEVVITIPFIQKPVMLAAPRTIAFGWVVTPSKPVRKDWRTIMLYRGVEYTPGDYTFQTPNYPKPFGKPADYQREFERLKQPWHTLTTWYAFGPFMWVGAPEYAEWWREWRYTPSEQTKPDPNSTGWGPACHNSSGSDLFLWRLDQFVKQHPQRGIYVDCMANPQCNNEAHGCGYVDTNGVRQCTGTVLATRRHYERMYNIIKASDPTYGWVWYDGWAPLPPPWGAFADDNWIGEGYIGPLGGVPQHNYYDIVDLPVARVTFLNRQWGHLNSWLTEMATSTGNDPEKRASWYGKMIRPPQNGQPGQWTLPHWKDYEHVAGLGVIHDMWRIGGNDLQLAWLWVTELERMMHWDDQVRFAGYWELGDRLTVQGAIPEKVVCSLYYRRAGLKPFAAPVLTGPARIQSFANFTVADDVKTALARVGDNPQGWLVLAPMNNTDQDVTITLQPNLAALGFAALANGQARDLFRAWDFTWQGPPGWLANAGDPESPQIIVPGKPETFPIKNGAVTVTVPKRSFRLLLLEPAGSAS